MNLRSKNHMLVLAVLAGLVPLLFVDHELVFNAAMIVSGFFWLGFLLGGEVEKVNSQEAGFKAPGLSVSYILVTLVDIGRAFGAIFGLGLLIGLPFALATVGFAEVLAWLGWNS